MMLRRLKEDVEKSLAPKEETVVEVCKFDYKISIFKLFHLHNYLIINDFFLNLNIFSITGGTYQYSKEVLQSHFREKFYFFN